MPKYTSGVRRTNWDKHGETPSLLDFAGIVGDGVNDDSAGINDAISSVVGRGGLSLLIPGGRTFRCDSPILLPAGDLNLTLYGQGDSSIVKRGADMPNGQGLFDIAGSKVTLRDFVVDGNVTVAAGVNYSAFSSDPMHTLLTKNTSIWAHGGASDLRCEGLRIVHTGGYAILLDATTGDILDVVIASSKFRNNRPHLFGTSALDLSYGSWTGGIHYQCDGTLYRLKNLLVDGCSFQRCTGNQVWGHGYAYTKMHENVRVTKCDFEDIGRDCVELGNTIGGLVSTNIGRRIGYIATDDVSAAQPKYLGAQYAVFIDTTGTTGVDYLGNTCISALGAFFDLDGFAYGRVSGNTCRVPSPSDPEYTEDLIALWPGNYTYGIQTANNYYAPGGTNVSITDNTFINCGYGAIRLFSARGCHVAGNTINHPSGAAFAPIILGNFVPASGGGQIDTADTDITDNNIQWSPGSAAAAIQELENWGVGALPWAGEKNWVAGNHIFGANAIEFAKAPSSNSIAGTLISNAAAIGDAPGLAAIYADGDAVHLSVDGNGFKPLARVGGTAKTIQFVNNAGFDTLGSADLQWDDATKIMTVAGGGGVVAKVFNSSATGTANAFQQASGTFTIKGNGDAAFQNVAVTTAMTIGGVAVATQAWVTANFIGGGANISYAANVLTLTGAGNGVVATTFNSSATGSTAAIQQATGTFSVTGAGDAAFQSVGVTNGVVAAVFNSTATGTAHAIQQATGTFLITGAGDASFQSVGVTNGVVATVFNSTATGATHAIQQASGTFYVTGAGDAAFQSIAVTGLVAAGSMKIGGSDVATQAWVSGQGYLDTSYLSGYPNLAAAVTDAENYSQGQLFSGLTSHLASFHGAATAHTHDVVVGGITYTTTSTHGTP